MVFTVKTRFTLDAKPEDEREEESKKKKYSETKKNPIKYVCVGCFFSYSVLLLYSEPIGYSSYILFLFKMVFVVECKLNAKVD